MNQTNDLIWKLEQRRARDDRGSLASLRRGLGQPPGSVAEVSRVVEHMLDDDDPPSVRDTLYVIAPLFAYHHDAGGSGNMGDHFRALVAANEDPPPNVERRFVALLSSEPDDLPDALRQAISLLKSKPVPVNRRRLFDDVQRWLRQGADGEQARQNVRLQWSQRFWRLRGSNQTAGAPAPQTETESQTTEEGE